MRVFLVMSLLGVGTLAAAGSSEPVGELLARAERTWRGDPTRAAESRRLMAEVERRSPRTGALWFGWAEMSFATGNFQDASVGFETALRRGHRPVQAKEMLARSLFSLGVKLYRNQRDRKPRVLAIFVRANELISDLARDSSLPPADREAFGKLEIASLMNLAAARQWIGDFTEATKIFEGLVERFPESYVHRINLGKAYIASMRWEDALTAVERARELKGDPKWLEPHSLLGSIHSHLGRFDLAEQHYAAYLAERPDDVEILQKLGGHYLRQKRFGAAAEILSRVVELDPDRRRARKQLASALRRLGRDAEAERHEEAYRQLDSEGKARRKRKAGLSGD